MDLTQIIAAIVVVALIVGLSVYAIVKRGNFGNVAADVQDVENAVQEVQAAEPVIAQDVNEAGTVVAEANTLLGTMKAGSIKRTYKR